MWRTLRRRVTATSEAFGPGADAGKGAIEMKEPLGQQVLQEAIVGMTGRSQSRKWDGASFQHPAQHLLGDNRHRERRRRDGFDPSVAPELFNGGTRTKVWALVARNRQLRRVPARRPARPGLCRNEATLVGASIWITRSKSPTSTPTEPENPAGTRRAEICLRRQSPCPASTIRVSCRLWLRRTS